MNILRSYAFFAAPVIVAASSAVWADCAAEASAYASAKQSFAGDADAIYHVALPLADATFMDEDASVEGPVADQSDLSVLSEASSHSRQIISEMEVRMRVLTASVNPLFLKRRTIPKVFSAGAELSRCLSGIERAAFKRLSVSLAERTVETDMRKTKCIETKAEDLARQVDQIEQDPAIADTIDAREKETDPAKIDVYNFLIALPLAATHLAGAAECMTLDSEATGETMAMATEILLPVGFSMRDRKSLQDEFGKAFGKELDWGYWDMNEGMK